MPLLRTRPYLGMQVIIAVHRAHSCIRLPMLCSFVFVFLLFYVLLFFFFTSSLHNTFLCNESLPARRKLPDKYGLDFSMPCDQYVWYLRQYGITIKFWWATKTIACVDLELCMTSDQQLEESLFIDESMFVSTVKTKQNKKTMVLAPLIKLKGSLKIRKSVCKVYI